MEPPKSKVGIYYYSLSGRTKEVCVELSRLLNCYIEGIVDLRERRGFLQFFRNGFEALFNKETQIAPLKSSVRDFDVVIVGTPIWAGKIPPAVRTFVNQNASDIRKYALVFTYGFELAKRAVSAFEKILGAPPAGIAGCTTREVDEENFSNELQNFIKMISIYI